MPRAARSEIAAAVQTPAAFPFTVRTCLPARRGEPVILPGQQDPRSRALSACVSVPAVLPGGTTPLNRQLAEATRSAAAVAVPQAIVAAPVGAVLAAVRPSTAGAAGPALLTRRDRPGMGS